MNCPTARALVFRAAMSLGMDMGWRHRLVDALQIGPDDRVLDLGTGTADVALLEGSVLSECHAIEYGGGLRARLRFPR